jgi:hypothetical protein
LIYTFKFLNQPVTQCRIQVDQRLHGVESRFVPDADIYVINASLTEWRTWRNKRGSCATWQRMMRETYRPSEPAGNRLSQVRPLLRFAIENATPDYMTIRIKQ